MGATDTTRARFFFCRTLSGVDIFYFLKRHSKWGLMLFLALLCIGIWSTASTHTIKKEGALTFAVLDVGQGDALYIESPTGVQVVVDAGPDSSVLTELPKVMPLLDRSLDAVIGTHPDSDHIGGFADILSRYRVGAFIEPGIPKSTKTSTSLEKEIDQQKIPRYVARRGMVLDLGGGTYIRVLYPDHDVSRLSDNKANDGCIVAQLVYKSTSVLLACDAPGVVENRVVSISTSTELKSTILKVAHHGSKYSSMSSFVQAVSPAIAVISVGAHNTYGHPTAQTLNTLSRYGAEVVRTDKEGTIVFKSDGITFVRVK